MAHVNINQNIFIFTIRSDKKGQHFSGIIVYVKSPETGKFYVVNSNELDKIGSFEDHTTQDEFKEPPGFGEMFLFKSNKRFYRAYRFCSNPADPNGIRAFLIDVGVEIFRAFKGGTYFKMPLRFMLVPPLAIFCDLQTDQSQSKATLLKESLNTIVNFTVLGKTTTENNLGSHQKCLKVAIELTPIQKQQYDAKLSVPIESEGSAGLQTPVVGGTKLKSLLGRIRRSRLTVIKEGDEKEEEEISPEAQSGIEPDNQEQAETKDEFVEAVLKIVPKSNATDDDKIKVQKIEDDDTPDDIYWKTPIRYVPQLTYLKYQRQLDNSTTDPIKHHVPFMANRISINYNFPREKEVLMVVPSDFVSPSLIFGKFTTGKDAVNLIERSELVDLAIWMNNEHVVKCYKKLRDPPVEGEMVLAKSNQAVWCRAMVQEITGDNCRVS